MIWFAVVLYLLLSPVVCLVLGRTIRMRNVERPVEQCQAEVETRTSEQTVGDAAEVPVAV